MTLAPRTETSALLQACPVSRPQARAPRPESPILSIIIVNYRQWANTARLVGQLRRSAALRQGLAEVVVVDNHSPARGSRARWRRAADVSLRCLRQNRGFGRGVNEGARLSRGRWLLLLNPDVTVHADFLDRAVALAEAGDCEPRTGVIGLRLRDPGGIVQGSAGFDPTLLDTLLGRLRPRDERKCRITATSQRRRVPWVTGCGLLVRRECFEQLGGFDPEYFLYYEDADLGRRARAAGWDVWHEPALAVTHHHPLHGREVSPRLGLLTRHALLTYARKHWQPASFLALAAIVWLEAVVRGWLARDLRSERGFRATRAVALDLALGRNRRAFRRVWRAAQEVQRHECRPSTH